MGYAIREWLGRNGYLVECQNHRLRHAIIICKVYWSIKLIIRVNKNTYPFQKIYPRHFCKRHNRRDIKRRATNEMVPIHCVPATPLWGNGCKIILHRVEFFRWYSYYKTDENLCSSYISDRIWGYVVYGIGTTIVSAYSLLISWGWILRRRLSIRN